MKFTDLIVEYENVLDKSLCDEIISRFDADSRVYEGCVGDGLNLDMKRSKDLQISIIPDWKDIDSQIFELLSPSILSI